MLLTKEGREGGLVSYLLILFLLRKYRLWDIPLLTKKYTGSENLTAVPKKVS